MAVRPVGVFLVVGVAFTTPGVAYSQSLPAGVVSTPSAVVDPGDAVGDVVGTVTSTAGEVSSSEDSTTQPGDSSPQATLGAVIAPSSGGADTDSGGTASAGSDSSASAESEGRRKSKTGHASPGRPYKSRFDRLPSRVEVLLERLELGRHVRASLRRLEIILADSPRLRARVLRALRAEIARFRARGVTPAERHRIRRLVLVRTALAGPAASPTVLSPDPIEFGDLPPVQHPTEVAAAKAKSEPSDNRVERSGRSEVPSVPMPEGDEPAPLWVGLLLLLLGSLVIAAGVTNRIRHS